MAALIGEEKLLDQGLPSKAQEQSQDLGFAPSKKLLRGVPIAKVLKGTRKAAWIQKVNNQAILVSLIQDYHSLRIRLKKNDQAQAVSLSHFVYPSIGLSGAAKPVILHRDPQVKQNHLGAP